MNEVLGHLCAHIPSSAIDTAYLIHSVIRRPEILYLKTPLSKHYQLPQRIETWQKIRGLNATA